MQTATLPLGMSDGEVRPLAPPVRRASRFGDYEIVTPLARGGMGGVYLASHRWTGERVALKVLDLQYARHPEIVERMMAEHALASRVHHPGVVEIRGAYWTDDRVPYLVMEFLSGETLGEIDDRGPIALPEILAICAQAASALAALHAVGVIHCDVKHDNIFVIGRHGRGGAPRVKLIDFGVSRLVDEPPRDEPTVAGTPWFIAPEQWRGAPCRATDVYALGCLLYHLTTGSPPFDGSLPELMTAHLERRPSRPSWVRPMPIALERLILRSLSKRAVDRPTMHEVAIALAALADAEGAIADASGEPGAASEDLAGAAADRLAG
jgi:serine/threonine-protein kinase